MEKYKKVLYKYLPEQSVPLVFKLLNEYNIQLRISKSRATKLGDYRPPIQYSFHRISINHDLNQYQFLITLIHEFAHLKNWINYKNKVKPHGKEWKTEFNELMQPLLTNSVFPEEILLTLSTYLQNPSSSTRSLKLQKALRKYDTSPASLTLEEIPFNSIFKIYNGIVFKKLAKMRKRYKCLRMDNKKIYLVSPLIKTELIETPE
jgi:hypothetical protein